MIHHILALNQPPPQPPPTAATDTTPLDQNRILNCIHNKYQVPGSLIVPRHHHKDTLRMEPEAGHGSTPTAAAAATTTIATTTTATSTTAETSQQELDKLVT